MRQVPFIPTAPRCWSGRRRPKKSAVLRVNNAGPYWGPRTLDVSRAAAENLGFKPKGVGKLEVRVLYAPVPHEATYRHEREYDPVPGHLGQFETIDAAEQAAKSVMAFQTAMTAVMSPLASYRPAAPRNDPADDLAAPSIGAMVADASEPATRTRYAAVAPEATAKAIVPATVGPKKYTSHIVLAGTAKPAKSMKHAKRTTVDSRKPPKATQVARAAPRKAKAQVAALVRPVFRADSAHDITAAGFHGPVTASRAPTARRLTAADDMQRNTLAKKQPAKRLAAAPVRQAATGEGKSGKRLTGLPGKGRLKVSDARDVLLPAQPPLTGNRLREQIPGLVRDKIIRPRGVPAGPMLTLA